VRGVFLGELLLFSWGVLRGAELGVVSIIVVMNDVAREAVGGNRG
jgi:hypothetical protein